MLSAIEQAFEEGQQSDADWKTSQAYKNFINLERAIRNNKLLSRKDFNTLIPIERLDPTSRKVVGYHATKMEAAKWIVDNILKDTTDPADVCGYIEFAARVKWEYYGFLWEPIPIEPGEMKGNAAMVVVITSVGGKIRHKIYPSLRHASLELHVAQVTIRKYCDAVNGVYQGKCYRWYNKVPTTMYVSRYRDASYIWGIGPKKTRRYMKEGKSFNNITIKLDKKGEDNVAKGALWSATSGKPVNKPRKVDIYTKNNKLLYNASSIVDAAKYTGLTMRTISNCINGITKSSRNYKFVEIFD